MERSRRKPAFQVFYRHGRVYLTIDTEEGQRPVVYPEEIKNRMRLLGMPRVSTSRLREAIAAAEEGPASVVEWPEGERLASRITVVVAEDAMSAAAVLSTPSRGAAPPLVDDVIAELSTAGVTFGVDRAAVSRVLMDRRYDEQITVAWGREPVYGRSRRVEYRFKTTRGKPYLEMPFGRINLKELSFIDNRKTGDLLAILLPPVEAKDGSTVTGKIIPASRDDTVVQIPAGENTRFSADQSELYAAIDGNVRLRDGRIIVEPVVEVENVDYSTGNIYFDGSVVVAGHVADGFVVEAGGNIQIGKGVGRATLRAGENILLTTGMNGNDEGVLECGGNLFARYLESCTVRCRGNIFVEEAIMHSFVSVWNHCILNGRRAEFIAGEALVGGSFWCRKLGNIYDAPTFVSIGTPPELYEEYRNGRRRLYHLDEQIDLLGDKLNRVASAIHDGRRDAKILTAQSQLTEELSRATEEAAVLRKRVPKLREQLVPSTESVVVAEEVIYNGAVVSFGTYEYRAPPSGSWKTVLLVSHGEISAGGYDSREPPEITFPENVSINGHQ
ncbi:MAG: FapA family protein [Alkalispirochaeta sp.]